jgi:hypothetical protein
MAGILDKRTRFIDMIITSEGRRQLASGKLRAEFASFSDKSAYYEDYEKFEEARQRIYFESMNTPDNVIVLEKDDSGKLIDFDFSPTGSIVGENIFSTDPNVTTETSGSNVHAMKLTTGSQFASLSESISKAFLNNFRSNQFLATHQYDENNKFELSNTDLNFSISNSIPFPLGPKKEVINVNQAEPFLLDAKLTHLENFQYLPPVNVDGSSYGHYSDLRNLTKETWDDVKSDLGFQHFEEVEDFNDENDDIRSDMSGDFKVLNRKKLLPTSTSLLKEFKVVRFKKTSDANNLIMQVFENDNGRNKLKKLDIIDAGAFYEEEDVNSRYEKRVFYVGKIYLDDFNSPTFINIFTIIMD